LPVDYSLGVPSTPPSSPGVGRAPRRRRWGLLALVGGALALSGCNVSSPTSYGFGAHPGVNQSGQQSYHLWQWFSIGAVVIGAFTLLLIIWAALRYRASRRDLAEGSVPRQTQYHLPLEMTYTVVPIIIVIVLFIGTVIVENQVTAMPPPSTTIQVYAFQWGWQFTYPPSDTGGHGFSVVGQELQSPTMVMPAGENVKISLQSVDVVHGFYVREFNFSRYALPCVDNLFTLNAVKQGTFFGQCTQLCGLYHSVMFFNVRVVSPAAYRTWLAQEEAATPIKNAVAAKAAVLSQISAGVPVKPAIGVGVK
jgi:cytochrome c oxidase subunit 2